MIHLPEFLLDIASSDTLTLTSKRRHFVLLRVFQHMDDTIWNIPKMTTFEALKSLLKDTNLWPAAAAAACCSWETIVGGDNK